MRRFFDRRPPPVLDRSAAWGCLIANVFVLPGLGTLTAGRVSGYIQAPLALIGFGLTTAWCIGFVMRWVRHGAFPDEVGPYLWVCLLGILLFLVAWSWALMTSVRILAGAREAKQPPAIAPNPGPPPGD